MAKPTGTPPHDPQALERTLNRRLAQAGCVVAFERAWPFLVLAISTLALFLALVWSGLFGLLPLGARMVGVFGFATIGLAAFFLAFRFGQAQFHESIARLDRDLGLPHHPVATVLDQAIPSNADALTLALWRANQQAAYAQIATLRVRAPESRLVGLDPYALRFIFPLLAFAAYWIAGPEREARLAEVYNWETVATPVEAARLDAWIDPPAYTHVPPILIGLTSNPAGGKKPYAVPAGSELVLRSSDPSGVVVSASDGLEAKNNAASAFAATGREWRWILRSASSLRIRMGGLTVPALTFDVIPDQPPAIAMTEPPSVSETGVTLAYRATDDYGIASGYIRLAHPRIGQHILAGNHPPLVAPPILSLVLPSDVRLGQAQTKIEISDSPWAGATVDLSLSVRDDLRQEAVTPPVEVQLPQRFFANSLARALIEQRRILALAPDLRPQVNEALRALLIAPDEFMPEAGYYLGLRAIERRLHRAETDADLLDTVDSLWQLSLAIEDHEQGDEKKALDSAREALKKALENGASPQDIKVLTDRLKTALDAYLKSYAAKARKNPNEASDRHQPPGKMVRPEELQAMIDQMNDLAKRGDTQDASRMLEALTSILQQLQSSEPQMADPSSQEMNDALDELDTLMRDQRALRDDTFQQGKNGQESAEDQKKLGDRQNELEKRLQTLRDRMNKSGAPDNDAFGEAESAMKQAEGAIGEGDDQGAIGAQGSAIDGLRKGAQALAKLLDGNSSGKGQGRRPGNQNQQGDGNESADDKDPLGRSTHRYDSGTSPLQQGGKGGSLEKRSREVVEELRKRLGEPDRTPDELNYLRRLLERN